MVRAAAVPITDALVLRLFLCVFDWWIVRSDAGFRASRFTGPRYLFRCCTLSLRPDWRRSFSHVRRHLFLVPEDDGTNGKRNIGKVAFLALLHRLQYHIFYTAFSGPARDAAPGLYLRPGHALAESECARVYWSG